MHRHISIQMSTNYRITSALPVSLLNFLIRQCCHVSRFLTLLILLCFPLLATALTELEPVDNLAPMPGPDARKIGWEWHFIDQNGEPGHMRKVSGDDEQASYERTDGCAWTRSTSGFAPATNWSDCPSNGTSSVKILSDSLWPLQVGNSIVYSIQGTSSLIGRAWKSKRSCKVTNTVRIEIVSGIYDTFKVVCKERWGTRTWWLAPTVGTAVAYQQTTKRDGVVRQEMTKIVRPQ